MTKHSLRKDKTCLNCGSFVANKYCPKCGQENRESRESFFHLITEFIGDLVHYDSSFWKTTRHLLFSPAKLSADYMAGKRKSQVNPVKLYIFISFITFFLPNVLPSDSSSDSEEEASININDEPKNKEIYDTKYGKIASVGQLDSIHYSKSRNERISETEYLTYRNMLLENLLPEDKRKNIILNLFKADNITKYGKIVSIKQLDSIHKSKPEEDRIPEIEYNTIKEYLSSGEAQRTKEKIINRFKSNNIIDQYGKIISVEQLDSIHYSKPVKERISETEYNTIIEYLRDSQNDFKEKIINSFKSDSITQYGKIVSAEQLDSIHESKPIEERMSDIEYKTIRRYLWKNELKHTSIGKNINKFVDYANFISPGESGTVKHLEIKGYGKISSPKQLESIHDSKSSDEKIAFIDYMKYKLILNVLHNLNDERIQEKILEFMIHNLPKVLFIYMPIFAFWMWLLNRNKKKYYFDSGIFTLHFFSFILLLISILMILNAVFYAWLSPFNWIFYLICLLSWPYSTFYFFRANRLFYEEKRWLANIKALLLMFINTFSILIISILFVILAIAHSY